MEFNRKIILVLMLLSHLFNLNAVNKDSILTFKTAADYYPLLNKEIQIKHTPIPSYVSDINKFTMSLNGKWYFSSDPCDGFEKSLEEVKEWDVLDVPSEWYMHSYKVKKGSWAGYCKEFTIPNDWKNKNVIIRFGTVQSECRIYLNGKYVGSHVGSMTQFEKDLTRFIKEGVNVLSMYVRSESVSEESSKVSHYAKHQVGGILRSVDLIALPVKYIKSFDCDVLLNEELNKGTLDYNIELSDKKKSKLELVIRERGIEGLSTSDKVVHKEILSKFQGKINLENPNLWHAESPFLYTLELSLYVGNKKVETVKKNVGFRRIEIRGNSLHVNGCQVKLRGVARHDITAYDGRAIRDTSLLRKDVEQLRNANCNYIRTSHYIPDEYMLDLCDRYGIFVEDESPVCWDSNSDTKIRTKILFYSFKSMLYRDRSHPCILLWSIANESRWNSRFYPCLLLAKEETPYIPVKFSHSEYFGIKKSTDIGAKHYPGWQGLLVYDNYFRPMLFGEALHINCYNTSENITDPGLRDLWGDYIKYFVDNMQDSPAVAGLGIWSAIDEMYYPKDNVPCGYGPWGVVDGFRREKPEFWHMKMSYSPIIVTARHFQQSGNHIIIPIESRYNYVSTKNVDFLWKDGKDSGSVSMELNPMEQGTLFIPHVMKSDTLYLSIKDKRGFIMSEWRIPRFYTPHYEIPSLKKNCPLIVDSNDSLYIIKSNDIEYCFSRRKGIMESVKKNKKDVFIGGVKMYLIPLLKENEVIDYIPQEPKAGTVFGFVSDYLSGWNMISEKIEVNDNIAIVTVKGMYDDLPIEFVYKIDGAGRIRIDYIINLKKLDFPVRQIGIGFEIPKEYDTFKWKRKALWSYYPDEHIGRPCGETKAFYRETLSDYLQKRIVPNHPYSHDGNMYGSNDFRSTKHNIILAEYKKNSETLLRVESNGRQHIRSWVKNGCISFLVANYSNGGNEHYLNYDSDRTKYQSGVKANGGDFAGWIQLNLGNN